MPEVIPPGKEGDEFSDSVENRLARIGERQVKKREERKRVASSLRSISRWLEDPTNELETDAEEALNAILNSYAKKTQITLVALSHYRLRKMIEYVEMADQIDDKIESTLAEFDTFPLEDLRLLNDSLHRRMEDVVKFLERIAAMQDVMPRAVSEEHKANVLTQGKEPVFDTPKKREMILDLFRRIGKYADESEETDASDLFDRVMSEDDDSN